MDRIRSSDGTWIAYERIGEGPAITVIDGAFSHRSSGPDRDLAALLAKQFTVVIYDRRGRGESGDTAPYAVEREIEDLAAVIGVESGSTRVFGYSAGAALAIRGAAAGLPIDRLALWEPPIVDPAAQRGRHEAQGAVATALAVGDRNLAVRSFLLRAAGVPRPMVGVLRLTPLWRRLTAVAHTLPYDLAVVADDEPDSPVSATRLTEVSVPTLVLAGAASNLREAGRAVAGMVPNAEHRVLPRQRHLFRPKAVAPPLAEFFARS